MTDMSCRAGAGAGATGWVGMGMIGIMLCPWQIGGGRIPLIVCRILEPVLPRELLPCSIETFWGGWRSLERRRRQRLFDRVAVNGTMASACTTTPFLFFLLVFSGHFVCHDSLVPYTGDARPGYGASSHAPPPSLRECLPSFHSCSTEAWPRTSPTGPALYDRAWFSRRLRVKITCKCLVTVPASFPSENVLIMVLRKPFSLRQMCTHPTMQSYIGPGSQTHASTVETLA